MANYNSEFTGQQVDEAIQQVLDNHEDWSNKADPEDVAVVAGAVTALQTAMNGKADLQAIAGAYRLRFSQVPMCFLSSVTATSSYAGSSNNQIWFCTDGKLYYHANDTDYELGSPQYILYYCGNAIYKWGGSGQGFIKIVDLTDYFEDGRLKMDALPENLPTGGLSDDIYTAIKNNVDKLWSRLNELIGDLANLAFRETRTSQLTNNDKTPWPANEGGGGGGDEPVQTPTISVSPSSLSFNAEAGQSAQQTFTVQGRNLTGDIQLSSNNNLFTYEVISGQLSQTNGSVDATVRVTYSPNAAGTHSGLITVSSTGVSKTVPLSGTATAAGEASITSPTGAINFGVIDSGGSVTKSDIIVRGVNLNEDLTIEVTGSNFSTSVSSITKAQALAGYAVPIVFSGSNDSQHEVTKNGALRIHSNEVDYNFDLIGKISSSVISTVNVVYKLLNISAPSTATQDQVWGYYKETVDKSTNLSKTLSAINNATLRGGLTVKSGGVVLYQQGGSNNDSGITFNNGTLSITSTVLNSLTDDLIIEATAYTRTVTITASESGVTATIGGTTITCSTSNGDGTYSGSASGITSISSLSFASGVKTKITSIDFGGAQFTGQSLASMFSGFTALTQVKGLVVTGSVTSLASMFSGCSALTSFDTIGWDTSNVTTIDALCHNCSALTKVDLGSKDMGNLETAGSSDSTGAFGGTYSNQNPVTMAQLTALDVSYWNVPKLTSLWAFIYYCSSLTTFDASTWKNANKVANFHGMFASCSSLVSIDISSFDTSYANTQGTMDIKHMFDGCASLTSLKIGLLDTGNVSSVESVLFNASNTIALYCTSSVVPSINTNETFNIYGTEYLKVWFGNNGLYSNFKYKISEVHVPSGKAADYYNAWGTYIGLSADKFIDDL